MNKNPVEADEFMTFIVDQIPNPNHVETVIAAPAVILTTMVRKNKGNRLRLAAENCYYEDNGAFTGETSPKTLSEIGMHYVIVGHSERRLYFNETDYLVNRKVHAIFRNQMTPIVCCDETMGQRESGEMVHWVVSQVTGALKGVTDQQARQLVIAYEPSWAIGSGTSASADQAEEGCYLIRQTVADLYGDPVANDIRVLYGGSVTPDNISELMMQPDIDGVLAGGVSLYPKFFLQLTHYQKN